VTRRAIASAARLSSSGHRGASTPDRHVLATVRRWTVVVVTAVGLLVSLPFPAAAGAASAREPASMWAYYYIWFTVSSWTRAKTDEPLLGRYSSDEPSIMREHIRMAKQVGIRGFIVSWKSTPTLDRRLERLIRVAEAERFKLAIIYQGLDFERRPLPIQKITMDLDRFERTFARSPVFDAFGTPVVAWSGTWKFSPEEIESVTSAHRDALRILATERNPTDYIAKAQYFDGNAYYWSSVNPDTFRRYEYKLKTMGQAVHRQRGLWFAPAAPGFDGRLIGHPTVVRREGGETLRRQLDTAQKSDPDVIGLISWNEFSENTHIEPSRNEGMTSLEVLADVHGTEFKAADDLDSSAIGNRSQGPGALAGLLGSIIVALAIVSYVGRRKRSDVVA
jgi:hypothetical protein